MGLFSRPVTPPDPIAGPWLRVAKVAKQLDVSRQTIYRLCANGRLPCARIGGVVRIKQSDLEAFLLAARVTPEQTP